MSIAALSGTVLSCLINPLLNTFVMETCVWITKSHYCNREMKPADAMTEPRDQGFSCETLSLMTGKIFDADERESTKRERMNLFPANFSNTLHTFMTTKERERHREWMVDPVCKASRIMNSYTCHMLLADSWELQFPPLFIFLFLSQSPNLFPASSSHSTYCTYPSLVLHHHFVSPLSQSPHLSICWTF